MNATLSDLTTERLWATPRVLIDHIVTAYHDRLRLVLAELDQVPEQIASEQRVAGELIDHLQQSLALLVDRLETHLSEQEGCLFPMIRHLHEEEGETEWAAEFDDSIELLMDRMVHENQETLNLIEQVQTCLRQPAWSGKGPLVNELAGEVQSLQHNFKEHIRLEAEMLFPKVREQLKADGFTPCGLFW
jgi:iron-sulfur cluster repair protein YtfE (RIC family)